MTSPQLATDAIRQWTDILAPTGTEGHLSIWSTARTSGVFYPTTPAGVDEMIRDIESIDALNPKGIYLRMTTVRGSDLPILRANGKRGSDDNTESFLCLWADMDIEGPGHKYDPTKTGLRLPPDHAACIEILKTSALPAPTLWINSGGGLYPIWLLDKPVQADITAHGELSVHWHKEIQRAAKALGYEYSTATSDLSRILRIPGTVNRKVEGDHKLCQVVFDSGPRYTVDELRAICPVPVVPVKATRTSTANPFGPVPAARTYTKRDGEVTPFDQWEDETDWEDILIPQGWTLSSHGSHGERYWERPGGSSTGTHSASTGLAGDRDRMWCFSDSAGLPYNEPMTKVFVEAHYNHGGDFSGLARHLRHSGYGSAPTATFGNLEMPVIVSADPVAVEEVPEVPEVPELTLEDAEEQLLAAAEPERKPMARKFAAFACTNGFAPMEQMEWRDMLKRVAFLSFDDFKVIQKDAQETRKAERRAARKIQPAESDAEGLTLPDPGNPMAVARALVRQLPSTDGTSHSAWHREDWYTWTGSKWASQEEAAVRQWVYLQTEHATYEVEDAEGELVEKAWRPTVEKVHGVVDAMGVGVLQRHGEPSKDIACTNGVLELDSRALLPHTPQRFNLHSLPFGYDATAASPEWMKFLGQVLPGDHESVEFLQEWFGYVISGRTDLQKMASIIGPPRSGKGTIARVLEALLGPESVASPSMDKLGGQFGEQNLIGKRLATLSDVRWNSRSVNDAVPVLLAIIGEDSRDIPRKNREDWHGKIDARFMMMSNDTPSFTDASGALATRMIHIRMFESFVGKEDHGLTARLLAELPGILNWALEGLDRLTARGRFIVPQASQDVDRDVREIAQPVAAFVEEMCTLEAGAEITIEDLYAAWRKWNIDRGLGEQYIGQMSTFGQKMTSAFGGQVRKGRKLVDGKKSTVYTGIRTTNPFTAPPQQQWIVGNR